MSKSSLAQIAYDEWVRAYKPLYKKINSNLYVRKLEHRTVYRNADGLRHRIDGPALFNYKSIHEPHEWYANDVRCTTWDEFSKFSKISDEQLAFLILKYGTIS